MNPTPFFSIIVPIYNRPDEARELLESLAAQTDRDFELVLVEDGSTRPCAAEVDMSVGGARGGRQKRKPAILRQPNTNDEGRR